MRPNLFDHAPGELTQDAVLCWLIAWADTSCDAVDPALHAAGRAFVAGLFTSIDPGPPSNYAVRIRRQQDRCDIVAEIGDTHVLAIEDKTEAGEHGDQLARYRSAAVERYPARTCAFVFLKTGDQCSYDAAEAAGWTIVRRPHLLEVLRPYRDAGSDILRDYVYRLEAMEAETNAFRNTPPERWTSGRTWSGFYMALAESFERVWWGYVPNPSGGFMACAWSWNSIDAHKSELYLQLEEGQLVVKVAVGEGVSRGALRDTWVERVVGEHDALRFRRPRRLGSGKWMTVAAYDGDYRIRRADGLLDLDATIALLGRVDRVVHTLAAPGRGA